MAEGNETKLKIDGCTKSSRLFAAILNIFSDEKKSPCPLGQRRNRAN
jgi:hypothetical protein